MIEYPHIFLEGPQILLVDSGAHDPDVLLDELAKRDFRPKLWTAKLTGADVGTVVDIANGMTHARARGLHVGGWIQCGADPISDVNSVVPWLPSLDYVEFCVEYEYKVNPNLANKLVRAAKVHIDKPIAVISYGKRDGQIWNWAFAKAGWAVCPECYEYFTILNAPSYEGTWPGRAIHPLQRKIPPDKYRGNKCGVYRPEGLL